MDDNGFDYLELHCRFKADRLREDWDWWTIYDGTERTGKSTGAIWDAFLTSEDNFSITESVCYDADEFLRLVDDVPQYGSIILDEVGEIWFVRDFQTNINKALAKASQQIGDRNLNIELCLPRLLLLDKIGLIRHRTWAHMDAPGFKRGRTEFMEPHWKKYGKDPLPYWRTLFYYWFIPLPPQKYAVYKEFKTMKSKERLGKYKDQIQNKKEKVLDDPPDPYEIVDKILRSSDRDKYLNQQMKYDRDFIRYDLQIPEALARTVCKMLNKPEPVA